MKINKDCKYKNFIIIYFLLGYFSLVFGQTIPLSPKEIKQIGDMVFEHECAGKDECLLEWNKGEEFLSLGIGHFIWYPEGKIGPFEESFPVFMKFLKENGKTIPKWLDVKPFPRCPWPTKKDFLKNQQSSKAQELYKFLIETKLQQSIFLVARLEAALPLILRSVANEDRAEIRKQFNRVASSPQGVYALVDYVNFKGLGVSKCERYNGKGWGLLQILSEMKGNEQGVKALEEFVEVANKILMKRVDNSSVDRQEQNWLLGWQNRVRSYLE